MFVAWLGLFIVPLTTGLIYGTTEDGFDDDETIARLEEVNSRYGSKRLWNAVRTSGQKPEMICRNEYERVMLGMKNSSGTDLIIGAYDGIQWDPAQAEPLNWYWYTPNRRKVMIEAIPPIYRRLQKNARNFTNVTLLNAPVGAGGESGVIYCWNTEGQGPLEPAAELREESGFWSASCSSRKSILLNNLKVYDTPWYHGFLHIAKQPDAEDDPIFLDMRARKEELEKLVDRHVTEYDASVHSVGDLLDTYGRGGIGYIQVDIEDMTDKVMDDLVMNHLGKNDFLPKVILFEYHHFSPKGFDRLKELGYDTCNFRYYGGNVLAFRADDEAYKPA